MVYNNRKHIFGVIFAILIILICWFGYPHVSIFFTHMTQNLFFAFFISCIHFILLYSILALASAYFFFLLIKGVFSSISQLGIYIKLNTEDPFNGETLRTKMKNTYKYNVFLSIPLLLVVFYFLYPTGTAIISDPSTTTTTILSEIDRIYILAFAFVPAYLLSIRILANPTKTLFSIPIMNYYTHRPSHKNEFIKSFKREVISFYTALTIGAIFYIFLKMMQAATNYQLEEELSKFYPQIDIMIMSVFIIFYFIVLLITTTIGELILKRYQPYIRL